MEYNKIANERKIVFLFILHLVTMRITDNMMVTREMKGSIKYTVSVCRFKNCTGT
jgi:hypothetical protein